MQPSDIARPWRAGGKARAKKSCPQCKRIWQDQVAAEELREHLSKVEMPKSLRGPDGVHPQVRRELSGGLARPLQKGDAPEDWKKAGTAWAEEPPV